LDTTTLSIILIVLVFIFILVGWTTFSRKRGSTQRDPYLEALENMADGHSDTAMEKLKEAIRNNSGNIGAYLRLGDKLREQGFTKNALRIHKELTLRENLDKEQKLRINKSLLLDYEEIKDFESGISIAKKIYSENKQNGNWITERLINLYEKAEKWNEAIETTKKYFKPLTDQHKRKISLYLVFEGLQLHQSHKAREGRIKFREALKINSDCSAAYFYLGKSYLSDKRLDDAIKEWQNFCRKIPSKAHIVFSFLEKAYFDKGIFEDIESLYEELIDLEVRNLNTVLALVTFYLKKGKYEKARVFLEKAEEDYKSSPQLAAKKVQVLFYNHQYKEAASEALKVCEVDFNKVMHKYRCDVCSFESNDPLWRCPQCKNIDSFSFQI
jgi:lipopolysaccharide biosynthesis regulator YciM